MNRKISYVILAVSWLYGSIGAEQVHDNIFGSFIEVVKAQRVQGGFLIGKVRSGTVVEFLSKPVSVNAQGIFVIGFGRDFELQNRLKIVQSDHVVELPFMIKPRAWKIERVDGLPPATVNPKGKDLLNRIAEESQMVGQARSIKSEFDYFLEIFKMPARGRISGVFGSQRILNGEPKRPHFGLDIAAPVGTPVYAPASGVVRLAHPDMFYSGATIVLDHGYELNSTFLHLNEIKVTVGQTVKQGELIGTIGASGRASGPHLDWRMNWRDQRLDPALLLEQN